MSPYQNRSGPAVDNRFGWALFLLLVRLRTNGMGRPFWQNKIMQCLPELRALSLGFPEIRPLQIERGDKVLRGMPDVLELVVVFLHPG